MSCDLLWQDSFFLIHLDWTLKEGRIRSIEPSGRDQSSGTSALLYVRNWEVSIINNDIDQVECFINQNVEINAHAPLDVEVIHVPHLVWFLGTMQIVVRMQWRARCEDESLLV